MSTAASLIAPLVEDLFGGDLPVRIEFWDGSKLGPGSASATLAFRSPDALRRLLWAPGELGLSRGYVAGDIDIEGSAFDILSLRDSFAARRPEGGLELGPRNFLRILKAAIALGAIGLPPPLPPEEPRLRGRRHSKRRDAAAVRHHYDVGNDFYRLVLGRTMTYSCAYFAEPQMTLDQAQEAKYELISRKLGLEEGMRLLDVGCGWGGMGIHAAKHHGVQAVGVTISTPQAELAEKRVAEARVASQVEIRLQDYRDLADGPYEAISSIGMFEHVGLSQLGAYFGTLHGLLAPKGRLLNHAISRPTGEPAISDKSFVGRYVFPDGELHEVGSVASAMAEAGFEVRDVESLREHYAMTLRRWVANLEARWDEARELVGDARARIWRLYMAGSALGFEAGHINIHQTLGVKTSPDGHSGFPRTREAFVSP